MNGFWSTALSVVLVAGLSAQTPAQVPTQPPAGAQPPAPAGQEKPTFKVAIDLITNDVVVRDEKGQFVPDLKQDEFEIYEEGVKQDVVSMMVFTGGRVTNLLAAPPPPPPEGIILPPSKPINDTSGRIFLFFVDDLHMQFQNTGRIRDLFKKISKDLLHDGDMFAIVSSGPSSIAVDMTYDRTRLDEAIKKIAGNELTPTDIIQGTSGAEGPSEVRYRAHVAFSTVEDVLTELEKVHNRRKAVIYVSDGYDFSPYLNSRYALGDSNMPFQQNESAKFMKGTTNPDGTQATNSATDPAQQSQLQNEEFADADLARELGDLTRAANRANTTFYTIDPRGLVGGSDIAENVDPTEWNDYLHKSIDSLRVLAEETGGIAVVNQNDFDKALKRIDGETSDYYVLGYYSKNSDPTHRRRQIEVKVTRKNLVVNARKEYVLKPPPSAKKTPPPPKPKKSDRR